MLDYIKIYSFKKNILIITILLLIGLNSYTNYQTIQTLNKNETVVIAVEDGQTRLLTSSDEEILTYEKVNFLKEFISYYFNFNTENYREQIGEASSYMTKNLWENTEKPLLDELVEFLEHSTIDESSKIKAIAYDDEKDLFRAILYVKTKKNGKAQSKKRTLYFKIKEFTRNKDNKWGLKISDIRRDEDV